MFSQLLHKGVLVFIDDILVYSLTLEDHVLLFVLSVPDSRGKSDENQAE